MVLVEEAKGDGRALSLGKSVLLSRMAGAGFGAMEGLEEEGDVFE